MGSSSSQQLGRVDERLCELDSLLLTGRVPVDQLVPLVVHSDVVECDVRALDRVVARQPRELAHVGADLHRVEAEQGRVVLGHVAEPRADLGAVLGRRPAEHLGRAVERHQPEQALEQRRFAGAVGAEQADDLAIDLCVDARERGYLAVVLRETYELDDRPTLRDHNLLV